MDNQPTPEQIEALKETRRQNAFKNLRDSDLLNLSTAYLVQREDSGYGKQDNVTVHDFLYIPSMNSNPPMYSLDSGKEHNLMLSSLMASRQDGRMYSGQITEYDTIHNATGIIQDSVASIKVSDIMELVGTNTEAQLYTHLIGGDRYVSDLLQSENEEEKELGTKLVAGYMTYITNRGISKAFGIRADSIRGGLEKILMPEAKEE